MRHQIAQFLTRFRDALHPVLAFGPQDAGDSGLPGSRRCGSEPTMSRELAGIRRGRIAETAFHRGAIGFPRWIVSARCADTASGRRAPGPPFIGAQGRPFRDCQVVALVEAEVVLHIDEKRVLAMPPVDHVREADILHHQAH